MTNDRVAKTVAVYDQIAHTYAANIEEYYSSIDRDAFLALVPNGGKILDAGCAAGRDSRYFDSKGYTVVGVDLSNKLLEIAKKQSPHIEFHIQDIRSLQFFKETFHGIYATAILLHLNRDEVLPVLRQFYTLLKPRGIVCIQVKEGAGEADVQEKLSEAKSRHFTYFRKREIEDLLKQAGFTIHNSRQYNENEINPNWRDLVWISCLAKK